MTLDRDQALRTAAREVLSLVRANADANERGRRLAPELVEAFTQRGLFGMLVPRSLGGGEASVETFVDVIETIAQGDGSAGWCVMIAATSGLLAAYLDADTAREIYAGNPRAPTGGVFAPMGRARVVDGGYELSGRWSFASGSEHCEWLSGGALIVDANAAQVTPPAPMQMRMLMFPRTDCEIIDTWDVAGLRGTGSHDIAIRDYFVPRARSLSLVSDRPRESGALYTFPVFGLLALGVAAVALGVARHALDCIRELAAAPARDGGRNPLAKRGVAQLEFARAEGALCAARSLVDETVGRASERASRGEPFSVEGRARLRLAATHAAHAAERAVDAAYELGGGGAIYAKSPLQRCFRDVHVATHHIMVANSSYELMGRVLLGVDVDVSQL